ncbi:MAG TPA: hypothetical protein ENI23_14900 [bacterium]|nr:hypothetical protein [bacterium]
MKRIEKNHGHWQLRGDLRDILIECRAEESTRYAISGIHVGENVLASTDGRRLVELQATHKIPEGNYFCTTDGFLLNTIEGNFPKYKDIIPEKSTLKKIVEVSAAGGNIIGLILGELCHAGCIIKLSLYEKPIEILSKAICGNCKVYVNKDSAADHPFMIEVETSFGDLRYIQMPINVENEVKDK